MFGQNPTAYTHNKFSSLNITNFVVGMPESSVDMDMLIVISSPPPPIIIKQQRINNTG